MEERALLADDRQATGMMMKVVWQENSAETWKNKEKYANTLGQHNIETTSKQGTIVNTIITD